MCASVRGIRFEMLLVVVLRLGRVANLLHLFLSISNLAREIEPAIHQILVVIVMIRAEASVVVAPC